MGWAQGSHLAEQVWELVRPHITKANRQRVAAQMVELFENEDADDWSEDQQLVLDAND